MHASTMAWWGLVAATAVGLAAVVRTRWLQSHTLAKCVALSVALHALLAGLAALLAGFTPASWGSGDDGRMTITMIVAADSDDGAGADAEDRAGSGDDRPGPADDEPAAASPAPSEAMPPAAGAKQAAAESGVPADVVPLLAAEEPAAAVPVTAEPRASRQPLPAPYANRAPARRAAAAAARGGSEATEAAVQRALEWLAENQSADGRWSAAVHGAGVERSADGRQRRGAGGKADHGVTGLALLAFLGAGSTHVSGPHAATVDRGIRFLVDRQRGDGSLAGDADFFAALYCHGMASLAVAECVAMSGDDALKPALSKAIDHTLAMQHPTTGGWRYAAGDKGDTSQLGWQVMLLETAAVAGMDATSGSGIANARVRAQAFLQSVSSGLHGGLAAYRPGERPTMPMTAEALVCRLLLGLPVDHPTAVEAIDLIARSSPDAARPNAYAWYYATLASFHVGGPQWERWNSQVQAALLPLQRRDATHQRGSWDPDPVWGGHGGRVYATALAALTLEVYYRHQPMHLRRAAVAANQ